MKQFDLSYSIKYTVFFLLFIFFRPNSFVFWAMSFLLPILLWYRKDFSRKYRNMPKIFRQIIMIYFIFCVFVIIRGVLSSNPVIPLTRAASMITIIVMVVFFFLDIDNINKLRNMFLGIILSIDVLIFYCLLFHFNGLTFDLTYDENLIGNKNTFGNYLFLAFVSNVLLLETKNGKFWNTFLYINLLVIVVSVLLSLSFKIMITSVCCLGVFLLRKIIVERKRGLAIVVAGVILIISPFLVNFLNSESGILIRNRFYILIGQDDKASIQLNYLDEREDFSRQTYMLFKENPIAGVGLEVTRDIFEVYSHNTFMEVLAGGGIILMIPFILLLLNFWKPIWRKRNIVVLAVFFSVIFIANGIKIYDTHSIMLILFIALYYSLLSPKDMNKEQKQLIFARS